MTAAETIQQQLAEHRVFLYMKGTPMFPQCGFSARVVQILEACDATFGHCNILEDEDIRQAIKNHSDWPTLPQLYIDGEFIGGCDIVAQLYESGQLKEQLASVVE